MDSVTRPSLLLRSRTFVAIIAAILLSATIPSFVFAQALQGPAPTGETLDQTAGRDLMSQPCSDFIAGIVPSRLDIGCAIAKVLNWTADFILEGPMNWGREAAESSFNLNQELSRPRSIDFVDVGWPILRDIANIFFIFIFLWIALATIFDLTQYSARSLLPRFVIAALLINFSLPIGAAVVSLANNFGNVYFSQVNTLSGLIRITAPPLQLAKKLTNPPEGAEPVASAGAKEAQLKAIYDKEFTFRWTGFTGIPVTGKATGRDCETYKNTGRATTGAADYVRAFTEACAKAAGNLWTAADFISINERDGLAALLAKQFVLKIIIYPPIVFLLFAVAVIMIIRYITLVFLLALSPMAFLGMILPGTRKWWNEWWDSLIKWSLFFPIFAIFFYISIRTLDALNKKAGGADFMSYLLTIAFILGSLIAAQKIGISAAGTAMAYGKKFGLGAARLAGRGALAPARFAGTKAREVGGQALSRQLSKLQSTRFGQVPGIGNILGRAQAGLGGLPEEEFKRKYGTIMKGSEESVVKYAAGLAERNPGDAAKILEKMGVEKRRKGIAKMSGSEATTFGKRLSSIGADNLVRSVSNNPETLVDLMQPQLSEEAANLQATIQNPSVPASEIERAKEALNDVQRRRREAIGQQLKTMNKRGLSPEFIEKMDESHMRDFDKGDISAIASTREGAQALSKRLNEVLQKQGPGYIKPEVSDYLNQSPGRVILRGGVVEKEKTKSEKLADLAKEVVKEELKEEGEKKKEGPKT